MIPALAALLGAAAPIVEKALDKAIPDPTARVSAEIALLEAFQRGDLGQLEVNKVEAANPSLYVSGWRPFIGWVCGAACAYQYILLPLVTAGFTIAGKALPALPSLDGVLWELTFGMLGMAGLRSFDKLRR